MGDADAGGKGLAHTLRRGVRRLRRERRCLACACVFRDADTRRVFCPACAAAMPRRALGFCPDCGELAAWPELPLCACAHCLDEPPPWRDFLFHGPHEGLLRALLIQLKFQNRPLLGHALGTLLSRHPAFPALGVDLVVPVPLHPKRLALRGYNQAQEIARPLAHSLRVPLAPDPLWRIRATPPQTGTCRDARKMNTLNAFAASTSLRGSRVLLVDDTLTTGATLSEAASALLQSGAASVSVAVVSRTPLHYAAAGPGR